MTNRKRLIEVDFPLKQASLTSVHEKNVRHGHISTLHMWPARRPLAASRAALMATLLPDPGHPEVRKSLLERLAGRVVGKTENERVNMHRDAIEKTKESVIGGILQWKQESSPDLAWIREEIRKAYGGQAPKVLDPFAGGGAIPLEAARLGCAATATDINPVAWFILKCTLVYPRKLGGQTHPLPSFVREDRSFMEDFLKDQGIKGLGLQAIVEKTRKSDANKIQQDLIPRDDPIPKAPLAWHVHAWSKRVIAKARKELASCYPVYAEFEPLQLDKTFKRCPIRLVEFDSKGRA